MRGGHFQANKSGGGLHHQVWNILHLNSSRLLIVIIWNRILISTFIAGIVHPRSRQCRLVGYGASSGFDERGWGHKNVRIYSFLSFCFVVNTNTEHVLHMWFASGVRCHSFAL